MERAVGEAFGKGPFEGRLPGFHGQMFAWHRLTSLEEFEKAEVVKVDATAKDLRSRQLIMDLGKALAVTRTESAEGFYSVMSKRDIPFHYTTADAVEPAGTNAFANLVPLRKPIKLDLVVLPSLAVDPETGGRVGLGLGKNGLASDLECAILKEIGAIQHDTCFVTIVHSDQLCDFRGLSMEKFDVPVDIVLTPAQTHYTRAKLPKPFGIDWELLKEGHFHEVTCLERLKLLRRQKGKRSTKSGVKKRNQS